MGNPPLPVQIFGKNPDFSVFFGFEKKWRHVFHLFLWKYFVLKNMFFPTFPVQKWLKKGKKNMFFSLFFLKMDLFFELFFDPFFRDLGPPWAQNHF